MAGFLLYILYVTVWLCFSLSQFGLAVSGAARSFGVPLSQYIDDHHLAQLLVQSSKQPWAPSYQNAEAAAYILCYLLVEAGYFVNLSKSQCIPSRYVLFLGFICTGFHLADILDSRGEKGQI